MASLLRLIGEHPFISVPQLLRMTGVSQSRLYRDMQTLEGKGLVAAVNPREPAVRARSLYYLTRPGGRRLAMRKRQGRPRFLERVSLVYEVRNLLISAQWAGIPLVKWQVLTAAVKGTSLHAIAQTLDGRYLIVEWDRGDRPARLYRQRLGRLAELAKEKGAGLLLVAADQMRGAMMLSHVAGKLDVGGPHAALTSRPIIAAQGLPAAACYVPALGDSLGIGDFVRCLPEPEGAAELLGKGVVSFKGAWKGNAALVLELGPYEKRVLRTLAGLPLVSAEDLMILVGGRSKEWLTRVLRSLKQRGLIGEYVADPTRLKRYYYASEAGLSFLAAGCGAPTRAYARARGWALRRSGVSVDSMIHVFEHTQEARELVVALAREARRQRQRVRWFDEREAHVYFGFSSDREVLAPDARVHWGSQVFFVEVDRGTSSFSRIIGKLQCYHRFRSYGEHRRFGDDFSLLVVAPNAERERQWVDGARRVAWEYRAHVLPLACTTRDALQKEGAGAPIWLGAQRGTARRPLVGESR